MLGRALLVLAVVFAIGACSGGGDGSDENPSAGPGASSAEAAVSDLLVFLTEGDFNGAVSLAIPGQAALASLAEGASDEEVASSLRDNDGLIAANFWSGFAQSVADFLAPGVDVVGSDSSTVEGVAFEVVDVMTAGGVTRQLTTRDVDGYRIDIFATFGPGLASRLYPQVERLQSSPTEDAELILAGLRDQVPSLAMAAQTPDLAPNVVQDIIQLIELITRVS